MKSKRPENTEEMNKDRKEVLAFEYYGCELGRDYYFEDLQDDDQIEMIFDLAQILRLHITASGWQHLYKEFGLKRLFDIDNVSGWLDTEVESEWIESITYQALVSGYNPLNDKFGEWDSDTNWFKSKDSKEQIDWKYINQIKINNKPI